ncbi:pentapeptide repeat-containing protein [Lentzea sp. NPDC051213]|uniref:pentapeptide repeat-containing protein n=1 Tax=Lentzea sp. NPDC051213 TaxID=3364126 RepID=UPI0037876956
MTSPMPQPSSREPLQPMPRKVIALVAAGIALVTIGLVLALWWWGTAGLTGKELVTARLDALRTGLSIGIGGGGVFALYLAWRRQHATEVGLVQKERDQADVTRAYELQRDVAAATERDAADRRVTDLYTKASEQLGSDKAPVRLAGIYALERLAQDNPEQRQTIVNLLCAYLRMPYLPPGDDADADHRERVQEGQVRRTAQQVLASHLRPDAGVKFWAEALNVNLGGATLLEADFHGCRFGEADFGKAVFVGDTKFWNAEFSTRAGFSEATFHGVGFMEAEFGDVADFQEAKFRAAVRDPFDVAHHQPYSYALPGDSFAATTFNAGGNFEGAVFDAGVDFSEATGQSLQFGGAGFRGVSWFKDTENHALCEKNSAAYVPAIATIDAASEHSIWPEYWVISEDGVIGERLG